MTNESAILDHERLEAALGRIGYGSEGQNPNWWGVLEWLVKFAQQDIKKLTPGAWQVLQEDYRALQEGVISEFTSASLSESAASVSIEKLEPVQALLNKHITEIAERGSTSFGPFEVNIPVSFPRVSKDTGPLPYRMVSGEIINPSNGQGLLYLLAQLLQRLKLATLKCPTCKTIFLQPRIDARFCSPKCRTRANAAKRLPTGKKRGRPRKFTNTHPQKGKHHGKKGR